MSENTNGLKAGRHADIIVDEFGSNTLIEDRDGKAIRCHSCDTPISALGVFLVDPNHARYDCWKCGSSRTEVIPDRAE